jgi:hypothetical protein
MDSTDITCQDVQQLRSTIPLYFFCDTPEDKLKWLVAVHELRRLAVSQKQTISNSFASPLVDSPSSRKVLSMQVDAQGSKTDAPNSSSLRSNFPNARAAI